jgi:arginyl-tRNA synthetase
LPVRLIAHPSLRPQPLPSHSPHLFTPSLHPPPSVYIQYAHVRLASVERNNPNVVIPTDTSVIRTDLLTEEKAHDIVYLLASYPDVVKLAYKESQPCAIVTFAFKLAHAIGGAWDGSQFFLLLPRLLSGRRSTMGRADHCLLLSSVVRVQNVDPELATARLYLFICARDTLGSAMKLLTLTPLHRM